MLDKCLEEGLIELPELRRPEEIGRTNDPKYCKYHKINSHLKKTSPATCKRRKNTLDEEDTK